MAVTTTDPKKMVIAWRYKEQLAFFGKMDALGLSLAEDFPDWQRTANTLQVENKKYHRRSCFGFKQSFYECDGTHHIDANLDCARSTHQAFQNHIPMGQYSRFGMRFWFALTFKRDFQYLVDRLHKRFHVVDSKVEQILGVGAKVEDLAYVVNLVLDDNWKCHLKLGPMRREEWFQKVLYEPRVFSGEPAFREFKDTIPNPLVCLDLDYFRGDNPAKDFEANVQFARKKSTATVRQVIDYFQNG